MTPVEAKYNGMNGLLERLQVSTASIAKEVEYLRERLRPLGISWTGAANDAYMYRLMEDLERIEVLSINMCAEQKLLRQAINSYQQAELNVNMLIGEMRR